MASLIRHTKPPQYNVDQLVTLAGGVSFMFRVSICDGGIRTEFNEDVASLKKKIGRIQRPGKPAIRKD